MLLSIHLDASPSSGSPQGVQEFSTKIDRIAQSDPDFVVLAGEAESGVLEPGRLEAIVSLSWLTGKFPNAILIAGLPALHSVPFHIARALSAADFMSSGRAGWMPLTTALDRFDDAYGVSTLAPDETLAKYEDFIRATQALWDSWDQDALVIDQLTGLYLDSAKIRRVAYKGPYFATMGPLNAARPTQGHPVLMRDLDVLPKSSVAADVVIGRSEAVANQAGCVRLVKVAASIDAAATAVAAGEAEGLHLMGEDAVLNLDALRKRFPSRRSGKSSARVQLNLPYPLNPFAAKGAG